MEIKYLLMIGGMLVVTYLPRVLPLVVLTRIDIPELIICWLRFIPPAILSALLIPGILLVDGQLALNGQNIFLLAALPTLAVAVYKKNIFLTVITGMVMVMILQSII